MNVEFSTLKAPAFGALAAGGGVTLSFFEQATVYIRFVSIILGAICAVLSIIDWFERRAIRLRRKKDELEEKAHLHYVESTDPEE